MKKDVEKFFQDNLTMYPHLKAIRDRLWMKDGKSRVSVMIGAGFSLNAKKVESSFESMALWSHLEKRLIQDLTHHPNIGEKDVLAISQIYVEEYGRTSLDEILKEAIPDDNYEPDTIHHDLLKLPWADIYTTNYDTLLERAKKHVYERNYQVIYDINDIPSSVQPRIVKLHGSFPSHRPFIFTKKDYEKYQQDFRPFVNMVQQSIMETTFVLIGFSGDDPNFKKWTTWVLDNLGEHKPKIYMIDCNGQSEMRFNELAKMGITLIDFKEIYNEPGNPYPTMFADIFDYLSYKNRKEKTKWPYEGYHRIENFKANRETYPGWFVIPNDIRKKYVQDIQQQMTFFINKTSSIEDKEIIDYINEIVWCCEKFYIPIEFNSVASMLEGLISQVDEIDKEYIPLLFRLLKEERLKINANGFFRYKSILEGLKLNQEETHKLLYEQILFTLNSDFQVIEEMMDQWHVGKSEIEWGIKKAIIYFRVHQNDKATRMLYEYLQTIRSLLAIKPDDYRLLSLESVVLHHLQNSGREDRLSLLNSKNCDVGREYEQSVISIKKFENTLGTKHTYGFDPGSEKFKTKYSLLIDKALLDSFAALQMQETLMLPTTNTYELDLAIRNLEEFYPIYCQMKKIQNIEIEDLDRVFSRESVYAMEKTNINILSDYLINSIFNKYHNDLDIRIEVEVLSRIYFALSIKEREHLDTKLIYFINKAEIFKPKEIKVIQQFLERIIVSKNCVESELFLKMLIDNEIISLENNNVIMGNAFFIHIVKGLEQRIRFIQFEVPQNHIEILFGNLNNDDERDVALLKLIALAKTKSLSELYYGKLLSYINNYSRRQSSKLKFIIEEIISQEQVLQLIDESEFVKKEIPKFYSSRSLTINNQLNIYFEELSNVFSYHIIDANGKELKKGIYKQWLEKFYFWWESQKEGFKKIEQDYEDRHFGSYNYLDELVFILGNNIWGTIPKEYLGESDINKMKEIYWDILDIKKGFSYSLIPCFERLGINGDRNIELLIDGLSDKKRNNVNLAMQALYDCLLLNEHKKISVNSVLIKTEILQLIKYGTVDIVSMAIDIIKDIAKYIPSVFNESDYKLLIKYANNYLRTINEGELEISTRDDLNLLTSYTNLVIYISKNKSSIVGEQFNEWKKYIRNNLLPEVRIWADFLEDKVMIN
ncbi:hypothetical protein IIU_06517 [Bacillus cereus VD133]|uniref:SIR2-like domain-containing protein n=1 Tax=Bacillus cereus VD133 TaxID=1053233 RepID=A0A9W5PK16_BACCE|nr:SIR2 family protein [Bacillus cereus]EOO24944.1 hypothetical protein IIU_06517 [Bacillus cereus VD133]